MIEQLLWGIFPALVGLAAVALSLGIAFRRRHALHIFAAATVLIAVLWSFIVLYRIFILGAWPTYLPHIVIGTAFVIAAIQTLLFRPKR